MTRLSNQIAWVLLLCSRNDHHRGAGIRVVMGNAVPNNTPRAMKAPKQYSAVEDPSATKLSIDNDGFSDSSSSDEILDVVIIGAGWAGIGAGMLTSSVQHAS